MKKGTADIPQKNPAVHATCVERVIRNAYGFAERVDGRKSSAVSIEFVPARPSSRKAARKGQNQSGMDRRRGRNGTYVRRNVPFRKEEDYCTNGLRSLESHAAPAPS